MWKRLVIDGMELPYEISEYGRVKSLRQNKLLRVEHIRSGYLRVKIYNPFNHTSKKFLVHRLVAFAYLPNPNHYTDVNHINGVKTDNHVKNLEWCTRSYNVKHAFEHGLIKPKYGENCPTHKYTSKQIKKVCKLLSKTNLSVPEISKITEVSSNTIRSILYQKTWKRISSRYGISKRPETKYGKLHKSIDRAIINGLTRKTIVGVLTLYGIPEKKAISLYKHRKEVVRCYKSVVQCTAYIDDGIELFHEEERRVS